MAWDDKTLQQACPQNLRSQDTDASARQASMLLPVKNICLSPSGIDTPRTKNWHRFRFTCVTIQRYNFETRIQPNSTPKKISNIVILVIIVTKHIWFEFGWIFVYKKSLFKIILVIACIALWYGCCVSPHIIGLSQHQITFLMLIIVLFATKTKFICHRVSFSFDKICRYKKRPIPLHRHLNDVCLGNKFHDYWLMIIR